MCVSSKLCNKILNYVQGFHNLSCNADYERNVRILPFIVKKYPSIMLNDEDTPWLRQDHNQGSYKKKFTIMTSV